MPAFWQGLNRRTRNLIGIAVLVAWTAGVGAKVYMDKSAPQPGSVVAAATGLAPSAWEDKPRGAAPRTAQTQASASGVEAPPISDLVTGLEARLAAAPDDANGWALLAQTYAFLGNSAGVERAIEHAVALGVDESALRARVQSATRDTPHPTNWIRSAVGG